ncbi:Tol-Pal system beta propeller repeat protein TolB [Kangiella sp. TOML190]|uniref:Tol-Pal system beta propeller repeat protein TolB n=1 Tax=Kangiella sp. TOML190 TaxID=2931351 RepID=UPI00203BAF6D|nr:Tol-Pal system beta propeller repeat protein TolB [Kangiella sp. TOML190]
MNKKLVKLAWLVVFFASFKLSAEIEIIITEGRDDARPIAVVPFAYEASSVQVQAPHDFAKIISDDLRRSGKFKPTELSKLPAMPSNIADINLVDWRSLGVDAVLIGKVRESIPGTYEVSYDLIDPFNANAYLENEVTLSSVPHEQEQNLLLRATKVLNQSNFRWNAHVAADEIYEKLTGERGAFATLIAYVEVVPNSPKKYQLFVADSDGYDAKRLFPSERPIMSPAWSPDGEQLAYVSFENGRSEIFIHSVYTNQRQKIASFKGFNSAPAWSPDGRKMAMVLSKDGNPEIYVMDLASKKLQRMTQHYSIDTEPSWSPDGNSLIFTSDRGGRPQIYQVFLNSGQTKRVTFEGRHNAGAEFSPDGEHIVMVHQNNGNFHIARQNLKNGDLEILTKSTMDESISIAPNGSMIIFSTISGRDKVLSTVSMDGKFGLPYPSTTGEVKAPAWSPFIL